MKKNICYLLSIIFLALGVAFTLAACCTNSKLIFGILAGITYLTSLIMFIWGRVLSSLDKKYDSDLETETFRKYLPKKILKYHGHKNYKEKEKINAYKQPKRIYTHTIRDYEIKKIIRNYSESKRLVVTNYIEDDIKGQENTIFVYDFIISKQEVDKSNYSNTYYYSNIPSNQKRQIDNHLERMKHSFGFADPNYRFNYQLIQSNEYDDNGHFVDKLDELINGVKNSNYFRIIEFIINGRRYRLIISPNDMYKKVDSVKTTRKVIVNKDIDELSLLYKYKIIDPKDRIYRSQADGENSIKIIDIAIHWDTIFPSNFKFGWDTRTLITKQDTNSKYEYEKLKYIYKNLDTKTLGDSVDSKIWFYKIPSFQQAKNIIQFISINYPSPGDSFQNQDYQIYYRIIELIIGGIKNQIILKSLDGE